MAVSTQTSGKAFWDKLSATFEIETQIIRTYKGVRVMDVKELAAHWQLTPDAINNYRRQGMPICNDLSTSKAFVYYLPEAEAWRSENVTLTGAAAHRARFAEDEETGEQSPALRKLKADADKAEEEAQISKLKRQQLQGSLIESETLDLAQAEQAVIYQSLYANDKKILPIQLRNKDENYIREYLDTHYENRMTDLHKLINKVWPKDHPTIYDKVTEWMKECLNT